MCVQVESAGSDSVYGQQDMQNAKVTFRQDDLMWTTYGCSVESHMTDIIDKLIWYQDNANKGGFWSP